MAKAPRDPAFPHPALEVGVAQYPTPVVPDYYTKSGHIILVVKEGIEKGNYNPQPLDGSVTYDGKDANKWPSTLYLVHQQPTPDGQYVYNTYANDRTLLSQDPWNYGIAYSNENPNYPIYKREYIVPRSQYSPVQIGSVDPVFGGNAKITKQEMAELSEDNKLRSRYVVVQRVYETIPGPSTAAVAAKSGLLGYTSTSKQVVLPNATPDALSTTILESQVTPIDSTKSEKITTTSSGPTELIGFEYDDFFEGNLKTKKQIVAYNTPLSFYSGLLSYKDNPIDEYKCERVIVECPFAQGNYTLPPSRTEYHTATYTSPTLVFGVSVTNTDLSCDNDGSQVRWAVVPNTRAAQTQTTIFKTITSYTFGRPQQTGDTDLFNPVLKHVEFNGLAVNFSLGSALCDAITGGPVPIHYCTGGANAFESWDIPATSPYTASDYLGQIGSYQKISWECKYWKAGIYESKSVYVKLV